MGLQESDEDKHQDEEDKHDQQDPKWSWMTNYSPL